MSGINEQVIEGGDFEEVAPPPVALVPVEPSLYRARKFSRPRPDPSFVTQLIAAEQFPQTRNLRRAAPADASSAYRDRQRSMPGAGLRTRQII